MQTQTNAWWVLAVQNVVVILGDRTLGGREFSCVVCGFGQVFIVTHTKSLWIVLWWHGANRKHSLVQILDTMADWFIKPPKGLWI